MIGKYVWLNHEYKIYLPKVEWIPIDVTVCQFIFRYLIVVQSKSSNLCRNIKKINLLTHFKYIQHELEWEWKLHVVSKVEWREPKQI